MADRPAPAAAGRSNALRGALIDIVAPIAVFYGSRALGASVWVALPVSIIPALGGALWPVTFVVLQVLTNVYFARSGFWRILLNGDGAVADGGLISPYPG